MKSTNIFKRKELKYLLTNYQKEDFLLAISNYIESDEYPKYTICNIYMDTPDFRLIRRSIEHPAYKEKMRLRSYGVVHENNKIFVELKKKYKGIVYKRRTKMYLNETLNYIKEKKFKNGQIESEIEYFLNYYKDISPAMYISYNRHAYTANDDNTLRITFDDNILWRDNDMSLTSEIYGETLLNKGECLMEIKCANALPLWLTKALSDNKIYKTSFSKYGKAYIQKIS